MNQLILDKLSFTVLPPVAFQMDSLQITVSELALHPSQLALNVQYHRGLFLGQAGVAIVQPIAWNVMETSHYVYPARMGITSMQLPKIVFLNLIQQHLVSECLCQQTMILVILMIMMVRLIPLFMISEMLLLTSMNNRLPMPLVKPLFTQRRESTISHSEIKRLPAMQCTFLKISSKWSTI